MFNDKPYFIITNGNSYTLGTGLEPNAIRGHFIKINGTIFIVGENGIYHLESQ